MLRGAELMGRWRRLHKLRSLVSQQGVDLRDIVGSIDDLEIEGAATNAAKAAILDKITEMLAAVHAEADRLGITAPFPKVYP